MNHENINETNHLTNSNNLNEFCACLLEIEKK